MEIVIWVVCASTIAYFLLQGQMKTSDGLMKLERRALLHNHLRNPLFLEWPAFLEWPPFVTEAGQEGTILGVASI
jgi:hypothetical protein